MVLRAYYHLYPYLEIGLFGIQVTCQFDKISETHLVLIISRFEVAIYVTW